MYAGGSSTAALVAKSSVQPLEFIACKVRFLHERLHEILLVTVSIPNIINLFLGSVTCIVRQLRERPELP